MHAQSNFERKAKKLTAGEGLGSELKTDGEAQVGALLHAFVQL